MLAAFVSQSSSPRLVRLAASLGHVLKGGLLAYNGSSAVAGLRHGRRAGKLLCYDTSVHHRHEKVEKSIIQGFARILCCLRR